ncbi:MAG: TonB-dependent receptor [Pseudomonadota bacterium]
MTVRNLSRRWTLGGIAALSACLAAMPAIAQEDEEIDEIVVEGSLRSLPTQDVGSVFGLDKTLLETPRSASTISSDLIDRFEITDIDELVALAPGTFTQSFFGVAGSLDVRGTAGETYFRGVRRLDNPGNYPTPIGASDRVDIVRGPASVIYGPSKIGGYLNFVPKSARASGGQYLDEIEGKVSYTTGRWDRNVITGEMGGPGKLADRDFGYYVYAEIEDSGSYYNNSETDQDIFQIAIDHDASDKLRFQFGGMYHDFEGNQIAGWNRLTQDLVDNGTYITGDAQPLDTDGDGLISHAEYFATADFTPPDVDGDGLFGINVFVFRPEFVTLDDLDSLHALVNPGTAQLDGSQVLVAADDTLENEVITLYFDLIYDTDNGWEIKNQLFYESYDNLNENAYGFSQFHDTWVIENKFVATKQFETSNFTSTVQVSPSIRYTDFEHGDDFTNEYFDRRDLTGPSTSLDARRLSTRIDDEYSEYYIGNYVNYGLAGVADFEFVSGTSVLLGLRYDHIEVDSRIPADQILLGSFASGNVIQSADGRFFLNDFVDPINFTADDINAPVNSSDEDGGFSWNISLSQDFAENWTAYATFAEQSTVIAGQGAEITSGNVFRGNWFDTSELQEFGVKASLLEDTLYLALAYYEQERTDFNAQAIVTNQTTNTEGLELEARWVVNENLILTFGYSNIEVINLATIQNGGNFSFYGAEDIPQIDPTLLYGGLVIGEPAATSEDDARRAGVPEDIFSFTGTYAFDNGLSFSASVIDVDSVFSGYSQAVRLPSYTLVNAGIRWEGEQWAFGVVGKNLTDERYFRANFPNLFGSQIVLPELPQNWQASVSYRF